MVWCNVVVIWERINASFPLSPHHIHLPQEQGQGFQFRANPSSFRSSHSKSKASSMLRAGQRKNRVAVFSMWLCDRGQRHKGIKRYPNPGFGFISLRNFGFLQVISYGNYESSAAFYDANITAKDNLETYSYKEVLRNCVLGHISTYLAYFGSLRRRNQFVSFRPPFCYAQIGVLTILDHHT